MDIKYIQMDIDGFIMQKTHKIQFNTVKTTLDSMQIKRIIEEGSKLYSMLFQIIGLALDKNYAEVIEQQKAIQFYLEDHHELSEAISLW
jgi:hypothetical protein